MVVCVHVHQCSCRVCVCVGASACVGDGACVDVGVCVGGMCECLSDCW